MPPCNLLHLRGTMRDLFTSLISHFSLILPIKNKIPAISSYYFLSTSDKSINNYPNLIPPLLSPRALNQTNDNAMCSASRKFYKNCCSRLSLMYKNDSILSNITAIVIILFFFHKFSDSFVRYKPREILHSFILTRNHLYIESVSQSSEHVVEKMKALIINLLKLVE